MWALNALGNSLRDRVYGPELMARAFARARSNGQRVYLYGGRDQDALVQLGMNMRGRFPGVNIVGGYAPPFRPLSTEERSAVIDEINDSEADVVWVGIGVPKQEKWMAAMRPHLEAPVLVGVGAAFDFHAGLVPQAPPLLQGAGLEWAYRLAHEPRRLWRRYLRYNPRFVGAFARQLAARRGRLAALNLDQRADTEEQSSRGALSRLRLPGRDLKDLLGDAVPATTPTRRSPIATSSVRSAARVGPWRVLDLGCGAGDSVALFRARDPHVEWVGLDVPGSPEASDRTRRDARFETFDGISMPFADGSFELVYCKQVLEHVRHPERLLAEVYRVLVPGGWFAGSTSQLELYHSLSLWNYTPVGFVELIEAVGLRAVELRPGIDGLTIMAWRLAGGHRYFHRWWERNRPSIER